jgi:hypothetical protein
MDALSRRFSLVPLVTVLVVLFLLLWMFGFIQCPTSAAAVAAVTSARRGVPNVD